MRSVRKEIRCVFDSSGSAKPTTGWAMFNKKGKAESVDRTRRGLLVGYDLMPLRGLEVTRKLLEDKCGMYAKRCRIVPGRSRRFAVSIGNKLSIDSCAWSVFRDDCKTIDQASAATLRSACGFVVRNHENKLKDLDKRLLNQTWYGLHAIRTGTEPDGRWICDFWRASDGRKQPKYIRMLRQSAELLSTLDIKLVPVVIQPS